MKFRSHQTPQAGFQIAPMIDIVFLLLIFFIVTWNYARKEREIDVSVPTAESGESKPRSAGEIIINVKKEGSVVINSEIITKESLLEKLTRISEVHQDQAVILRGDKETNYNNIIEVLDTCQQAGIWNVAFATAQTEETTP